MALAKSDVEGRRTLQRWAERAQAEEGDLSVVVVDPEDWSLEAKERRARRIPKVPRGAVVVSGGRVVIGLDGCLPRQVSTLERWVGGTDEREPWGRGMGCVERGFRVCAGKLDQKDMEVGMVLF